MARAAIAARIQQSQRANEGYRPSPSLTMPSRSVEPLSRSIMPDRYNNAILQGSNWVNEKARYLMGPHLSRPVETLARAGGLLSVGADLREGMKSSGDTVNSLLSGDLGEAGSNALMTAYTPLGMLIPGTINSVTSAAKGIVNRVKGAAQSPLGFRSKLRESAEALQPNMTTEQARSGLLKSGVKPDEMQYTGTNELLSEPGKISRNELLDHIDENAIDVQEVTLGESTARQLTEDEAWELSELTARDHATNGNLSGDELQRFRALSRTSEELYSGGPKHAEQQLPGGENYREVLLTMPPTTAAGEYGDYIKTLTAKYGEDYPGSMTLVEGAELQRLGVANADFRRANPNQDFTGGHYGETPNVLAHIRMNDRTGPNGERILNIEEIQSDWGQKGRTQGFAGNPRDGKVVPQEGGLFKIEWADGNFSGGYGSRASADAAMLDRADSGVPTGPFVGSTDKWVSLALKRIIRKASDEGYDRVTFTTGAIQNDRYDLSKQVSRIELSTTSSGIGAADTGPFKSGMLVAYDNNGNMVINEHLRNPEALADYIGKDAAEKLLAQQGKVEPGGRAGLGAFTRSLEGQDLKIGGEGMEAFYDTIIPKNLKKILKKLDPDAKVGTGEISGTGGDGWVITHKSGSRIENTSYATRKEAQAAMKARNFDPTVRGDYKVSGNDVTGTEVWSIDITPKMRGEAKKGQHLFSAGLLGAGAAGGGLLSAYGGQGRQEQVY